MNVEIRKKRIADGRRGKITTYWIVYADGRRVDSFLSRARAEAKAEKLRKGAE